jgi:hypothetical protein
MPNGKDSIDDPYRRLEHSSWKGFLTIIWSRADGSMDSCEIGLSSED